MNERIYSMETEYAITHLPREGSEKMNKNELFYFLLAALREKYEFKDLRKRAVFLENGSKCYYDIGHAEWSLPECRFIKEVVLFDNAAERTLEEIVPTAVKFMEEDGYRGEIIISKNNADAFGNTYGTHENYLIKRRTAYLEDEKDFFKLLIRQLVPFLVTRQILCGSGKVGFDTMGGKNKPTGYQVSQRADFINSVIHKETTYNRPIINLKDESFADEQQFRRLHLILGDANMSPWSALLKIGTTGIVLQLIEDNFIYKDLSLADPVQAIKNISADPTCKKKVLLKDKGRLMTPVQVQREYLEMAKEYFTAVEPNPETREILTLWENTLDKLDIDPMRLRGRLDWVIKKKILEEYMKKNKDPGWSDPRLKEIDINYHNICRDRGHFYLLEKNNLIEKHPLFDGEKYNQELKQAAFTPPLYTRAKIRSDILKAVKAGKIKASVSWNYIQWTDTREKTWINDPLSFFNWSIHQVINGKNKNDPGFLIDALQHGDHNVQIRALAALGKILDQDTIDTDTITKLFQLTNDKNPQIRWQAAETLTQIREKKNRGSTIAYHKET
jgi:proteasome accessory factor A